MATNFWEKDAVVSKTENWWEKDKPVEKKEEPSGVLRQVADVPLSVGRGALSGVRMIADAFGAGSRASEAIKGAEGYLTSLMSAQARNDEQEIARIMKDAEDKGMLEQVKAGFKAFTVAPVDLLSQGLGTAAPTILGLLGGKVLGAGALATRAVGAGIGAGMGAGTIKGSIYEETKRTLMESGVPEQQAEATAQQAQAYGGKNLDQILLGAGLGGLAGTTGVESAAKNILFRAAAKDTAKAAAEKVPQTALREVGGAAAKSALTESVPEFLQASQEQIAQNIALQREGFDVPTLRGAAGAGTLEALAGAGLGGAFGGAEAGLRRSARAEADRILAEEERLRAEEEERKAGEELRLRTAIQEPVAPQEPVGPSITRTGRAALLGGGEDPLAAALRGRREAEEAKAEVPLGEDYAFLQREKQRLLASEQTPQVKAEIARIDDQIQGILSRDVEFARKDAEAAKGSVFAEETLPPVESRGAVVAERDLDEFLARAAEPDLSESDVRSIASKMQRLFGKSEPETDLERNFLQAEKDLARLKAKSKTNALLKVVKGALAPDEVSDIGIDAPTKSARTRLRNRLISKGKRGTYISEMVDDGLLDEFLEPSQRVDSETRDVDKATESIKDKLRSGNYAPWNIDNDIRMAESIVARFESDIKQPKTVQYEVSEAADAEREARAEAEAAPAVPEIDALRRLAQERGEDISLIEEQAYEDARANPDLAYETVLAERLSDALGVERRFQQEGQRGLFDFEQDQQVEELTAAPEQPPLLDTTGIKPSRRNPQVQAAAQLLQQGRMSREEFEKYVDFYAPIPVIEQEKLSPPTSEAKMNETVDAGKRDRINVEIPNGTKVGLRMDLPARERGGSVVSIHEGKPGLKTIGKLIGFRSTGWLKNATFETRGQERGLAVAAGEAKAPLQTVEGTWQNLDPDETYARVKDLMSDPAWVQVGFDPARHGYFYDRASRRPVVAADEVYQVGQFLLAKNVKYAPKSDFLYQTEGQTGININPEEQKVEAELTGKSMLQVADWTVANAPNAFARVIAEKVRDRLRAFQRKGMKLEFSVAGGSKRPTMMRNARGMTNFMWGSGDKGTTIEVTLNGAAALNNQSGFPPGMNYTTVLHELLHVATRGQFKFMPNTDPLKKQLIELFNMIADRFNADAKAGTLPPVMQRYYKRLNNVLSDPDEMLAWGMTDKDVQTYFDDIKVGEKSVFTQLVELIRKALGLGKPYESALERLVRSAESLLDVDVDAIDAMLSQKGARLGVAKPAGPMVQERLFQREGRTPQTETEAFKRWFGDSKVVDEKGDPLVVYHGTDTDFDVFKPSRFGTFGSGIYFANSKESAENFGDGSRVVDAYVSLQNPWTVKAAWDGKLADEFKFDSPILDELDQLPMGRILIEEAAQDAELAGYGYFGQDLQDYLKRIGYDGVIATYPDGSQEVVAFRPEQIKSATGNIGTFDPSSADIRFQQEGEQPPTKRPRKNIYNEEVQSSWNEPDDTKLYGETSKDDIIRLLQDKMVDTKRVIEAITSKAGKIANRWNPYLQEELYHGRTAKATKDFLQDELRPLMNNMQRMGITIPEFEQYLHNRHAPSYNAQVAKVNPNDADMQDGGSGITNAAAQRYMDSLPEKRRKDFEALAKQLDSITKGTRQVLVDSGLERPETIKEWEKAFPNYVPLQREDIDFQYTTTSTGVGQGFDVRGSFSRRAMGSKRKVVDILANVAMQRERAIVRANKNRVSQALFGLAVQNPNPDFWLAIDPMAEVSPAAIEELEALGLSKEDAKFLMKEPQQKTIDKNTNEVVSRVNSMLRNNDNVLSMRFNGRDRYVFFNPQNDRAANMAKALKNLDADQLGRGMSLIGTITRWMAAVNTQYNPIFGAYNFLRDVQGAALQLSNTPLAGSQKQIMGGVLPALKGIYADLRADRRGEKVEGEWSKLWNEFQAEGGQTGFRDQFSRSQERAEALEREMKQITEGKAKAAGRAVLDWLSDYNDTMENAIRLSAYKVAKEKGMSREEAASLAKNLTVNFNRKGQIAVQAGALYAFFNAAVQGTTRLIQTLRGPMGKKIIGGGLLLGSMQAALLAMAGFDEEEPPEFVRERNLILPIGEGKYLSFPMPLGYHVIPGVSRILTEWALSGFKDTAKRAESLTGMFLEAFNPIGNAGWSVQSIAPTFADPLVALTENRDWTGKPIARKDFSNLDPTPGYTRAKDTASWFSEQIAYYLNLASGGTKYQPGVLSPTPDQLDYLIGQAFGGLGREFIKAQTTAKSMVTGEDLPTYKIPLVGRFVGDTKGNAAESARFYSNLVQLNKHENEIKGRREKRENVMEYIRDNPEARLVQFANKVEKDVQKLRQRRRDLLEKGADREAIQSIENLIANRMKTLNTRMAELEG